jgi:hypothetical protein
MVPEKTLSFLKFMAKHTEHCKLLHDNLHFGFELGSKTKIPFSHSEHCVTPVFLKDCEHDGWTQLEHGAGFGIPGNGGLL